jgi:outer membrane protein assembly factor BamA
MDTTAWGNYSLLTMNARNSRKTLGDRTAVVTAVLVLLLAPGVRPAWAGDDLPHQEFNGWKVTSFKVEGVPGEFAGDVKRGLAQTGRWRLLGGMQRPPFHARQLAEDIARVRLFLAQHGYPSSVVSPEITADEQKRELGLVLRVDPGAPVRIAKISLVGWPEGVARPDTTDEDVVRPGEILDDQRIAQGLVKLLNTLLDAGYASVALRHELVPAGSGSVDFIVTVEPGDFYSIDEVEIVGSSEDLVGVSRRVMNVKPGTDYSQELLSNASLDLRTTQLFRLVTLETEPIAPGSLKLTANLENGRMRSWDASVGTWSDNPWMVRAGWTHRNLFKHGVGYDVRGVWATHRIGAGTGVYWLGWLSPRARTRTGLGFLVEEEDAYRSEEASVEIVQSFRPRNRDIWNFGISVSNTQVEEYDLVALPQDARTEGKLLEVWTDRKWDRADDPLFPTRGGYIKVRLTYAPAIAFSEVPYASIQLDGAKYLNPFDDVILAARGRVGAGTPLGDNEEIIATRRFYAGGYNTHRGYGRRNLGPKNLEGNARGGEFVALAGAEVRFPLIWIFDGAIFLDAGNLWDKPENFNYDDIPVAIGFDLDLRTPLGPIRVGYGHNVANRVAGEPLGIWHFGIGYPW